MKGYWTIGKGDACYLLLKIMQIGLAGEMTFAGSRYRDFLLLPAVESQIIFIILHHGGDRD